jgi:hypothetical protein
MARPTFIPTEEQRRTVKSLSAYGIKQEGIARVLGIRSPKTLKKHFREELILGESQPLVLEPPGSAVEGFLFCGKTCRRSPEWNRPGR